MIRYCKTYEHTMKDGETIYVKEFPMSLGEHVMALETSIQAGGMDSVALGNILKACVVEENGAPLKQFKGMSGEDISNAIPVSVAMEIFEAISEKVMEGNE